MRTAWSDELIESKIMGHVRKTGVMPTSIILIEAGEGGLSVAIQRSGGFRKWQSRLSLPMRQKWTPVLVEEKLKAYALKLGRMPTANELRANGDNSLACMIAKNKGFRHWQLKLGLKNKGSETHRAQRWERWSRSAISETTELEVEHQTTKSPFDLLVGGRLKVDVKCSMWHDYPMKSGHRMRGYMFAGCKYGECCNLFFLVCLHDCGERVKHVFAVPSDVAQVQTITITERRIRTWDRYRNENAYTAISDLMRH